MRKIFIILLAAAFILAPLAPLYAGQMCEFICEIGMKFYREGRYEEALVEFKKALLVEPNYQPALKYIRMLQQEAEEEGPSAEEPRAVEIASAAARPRNDGYQKTVLTGKRIVIPPKKERISKVVFPPARIIIPKAKTTTGPKTKELTLKEILDLAELQQEMINYQNMLRQRLAISLPAPAIGKAAAKKPSLPRVIILSELAKSLPQTIEIEQGKTFVILGKNITRFLVTQPEIVSVEKRSLDEILITGKNIGYTDLVVWDENGRFSQEFLGIFPKPEGPAYEELARREAESARNFKLRYSVNWVSYDTGKRISKWRRSGYSWSHGLSLTGPTPYGDIDATTSLSSVTSSRADLTYLTAGLTNGQFGQFKGFNLRAFDFSPPFSNLAFSGATLRGGMLDSPAFNNKIRYSTFWGREGGGRYGGLSPSLSKTLNSFLEGYNIGFLPDKNQAYNFTLVHGWGRDRAKYLNEYDYDLSGNWNFDKWGLGYEIANDTETFAHLVKTRFSDKKLTANIEFRNVDKKFMGITGNGWRQGEIGGLINAGYQATEKLGMRGTLDVYKDRLYPAEENPKRLNEDLDWNATYRLDPLTSLGLNYSFRNDLGKISQSRYQSAGLNLNRTFHFLKDIYTYLNYYSQNSKNFSSHASDYINDRLNIGLRFSLIGNLYYYLNREINWLQERFYGTWGHPKATETGLDWSGQLGKTPLFGSWRLTYREEEDTVSHLSFLSGEDYLEGYSELSYRPSNDLEIYGSSRVRNVWAANPSVNKRIEGTFNAGMRYLWDTGFRIEAKGDIEGYVFKDLNGDGLRQREEAPMEGIRLWLGKDKSCVTDLFGYYIFKGVKGRKAFVNLDTSTVPAGFVLTIPATQEVAIVHKHAVRVDFGIASRTEINGMVFEDLDANGEYSRGDKGVSGVTITLENGQKAITDSLGRYAFNNVSVGEHTITLDLSTLPVYYLPKRAISKQFSIAEGSIYNYHIPLRRI